MPKSHKTLSMTLRSTIKDWITERLGEKHAGGHLSIIGLVRIVESHEYEIFSLTRHWKRNRTVFGQTFPDAVPWGDPTAMTSLFLAHAELTTRCYTEALIFELVAVYGGRKRPSAVFPFALCRQAPLDMALRIER